MWSGRKLYIYHTHLYRILITYTFNSCSLQDVPSSFTRRCTTIWDVMAVSYMEFFEQAKARTRNYSKGANDHHANHVCALGTVEHRHVRNGKDMVHGEPNHFDS